MEDNMRKRCIVLFLICYVESKGIERCISVALAVNKHYN